MPLIQRSLKATIQNYLFRGRIILIYGARRVGKTTLVQQLLNEYPGTDKRYINCDLESQRRNLEVQEAETLKAFLGNNKLVVLDEAQNVQAIGKVLKILVDTYPEMQIIATGSSAFDLANKTAESMTGRVYPFTLYPLSLQEIVGKQGLSVVEPHLEQILRFGLYPDVFGEPEQEARFKLDELVSNYLFKDILIYAGLKRASPIRNLLRLLAHQVGREVSYPELGQQLGIDRKTVLAYIDLLEQCFIIFRLGAFSRNLRKEISKSEKVYFYDLGVRNTLIDALSPLALRADVGELWENFCIAERLKLNKYHQTWTRMFFWRTYDQKEIDYIEEREGQLAAYEFKWSADRAFKLPKDFLAAYPGTTVERVDRSNYWRFLLPTSG